MCPIHSPALRCYNLVQCYPIPGNPWMIIQHTVAKKVKGKHLEDKKLVRIKICECMSLLVFLNTYNKIFN